MHSFTPQLIGRIHDCFPSRLEPTVKNTKRMDSKTDAKFAHNPRVWNVKEHSSPKLGSVLGPS